MDSDETDSGKCVGGAVGTFGGDSRKAAGTMPPSPFALIIETQPSPWSLARQQGSLAARDICQSWDILKGAIAIFGIPDTDVLRSIFGPLSKSSIGFSFGGDIDALLGTGISFDDGEEGLVLGYNVF